MLRAAGGIASREVLLRGVGRVALDHEVRMGHLVAVYPRAYARPWDADDQHLHARAALASVGGDSAISHTTALCRWGLPIPADQPVHVTAYQPRHPRGVLNRLVVHRTVLPLQAADLDGLPTVRTEIAAVTSWPLLRGPDQRAPLIAACRRRLMMPSVLYRTANRMTWIRGLGDLRSLVGLLAAGCESELELWGYREVFAVVDSTTLYGNAWCGSGTRCTGSTWRMTGSAWRWNWTDARTTPRPSNGTVTSRVTFGSRPSGGRPSGSVIAV